GAWPLLSCFIKRMRGSRYLFTTSAVPSVEPSSTTTSSQSVNVCARTDSIDSAMCCSTLKAGITIETFGTIIERLSATYILSEAGYQASERSIRDAPDRRTIGAQPVRK